LADKNQLFNIWLYVAEEMLWRKDLHLPTSRITGNLTCSLESISGASHHHHHLLIHEKWYSKADNTDSSAWTHHTHSVGITLAAGSMPYWVLAGYIAVQDISGHCTTTSVKCRIIVSAHQLQCYESYHEPRLRCVTGHLLSLVCRSGTGCQLLCVL